MAPSDSGFDPRQRRHLIRAQLVSQLIRVQLVKTRSVRFRICTQRAAKLLRSKRLTSQRCEVVFQLMVFGFHRDGKLQGGIHSTVQKGCEIISQQKGDFAALCKILPSAWSDLFAMAVTPSFQLRIAYRLKHWILDFPKL
uniref:Uncharacterized protein n=1 Tax=Vitis vinifera TaxID=29760 RepID=A5AY65_VITVI|nr:hypothetical protein VITISV_022746 [Vitis vinifera]